MPSEAADGGLGKANTKTKLYKSFFRLPVHTLKIECSHLRSSQEMFSACYTYLSTEVPLHQAGDVCV